MYAVYEVPTARLMTGVLTCATAARPGLGVTDAERSPKCQGRETAADERERLAP
jgi:hypothetical protein